MADTDFYNLNANRFYPFKVAPDGHYPFGAFDLRDDLVVDCGFTFGTAAAFDPAQHLVWLDRVETVGDYLNIIFKTDAPNVAAKEFTFVRYKDSAFGTTDYVELDGDPRLAIGFLITGNVGATYDLLGSDGDAYPTVVEPKVLVEPAVIVSQYRHNLTTVNVGNIQRISPDACCDDPTPIDDETVEFVATGLRGAIYFDSGYNINVAVSGPEKTITFTPGVGDGRGVYCGESEAEGVKCGDLIYSLSGVLPAPTGAMTVSVSNGFVATLDPDNHRIAILSRLETDIICEG